MNQAEITKIFKGRSGFVIEILIKGGYENLRIAFHYRIHFAPFLGLRLAIAHRAAQYCLYLKHIQGSLSSVGAALQEADGAVEYNNNKKTHKHINTQLQCLPDNLQQPTRRPNKKVELWKIEIVSDNLLALMWSMTYKHNVCIYTALSQTGAKMQK